MESTFTVGELVSYPGLDTRVVSGAEGLHRALLWAHSCEIAEPHRWLGPHELLMTIGLCIPQGSQAQRKFIADLDDAGLAGITIGDDGFAPRITKALLAESEARAFPVLSTGSNTPFAAIGRTVAAANSERQTVGVLRLAKLYQVAGHRDADGIRSGEPLRDLLGAPLTVVDDKTGCVLIGEGVLASSAARAYAMRTREPSHLVVDFDADLDALSLVHLVQVLTLDANAIREDAMARIRRGSELLELALSGQTAAAQELMSLHGELSRSYRVVSTRCDVAHRVPLAVALAGIPPAATERDGGVLLMVPESRLRAVQNLLADLGLTAAASAEHHAPSDLSGAADEALAEFRTATERGERWREYQGERIGLLARSHSEADVIITAVLGPLATEEPRYVSMRQTLFTYLENDMRASVTARELGLHRQSLVYRLKQIEAVTGRSVHRLGDLADFWLARNAWKLFR